MSRPALASEWTWRHRVTGSGLCVLAAAFLLGGAGPVAPEHLQVYSEAERSAEIERAAHRELGRLIGPEHRLRLHATRGILTLQGQVPTLAARHKLVRHLKQVTGVRAVIDRTELPSVALPPAMLVARVQQALRRDPAWSAYTSVQVEAAGAAVTLSGLVTSPGERLRVQELVEGIDGVREVHNQLRVTLQGPRSDAEILADIRALLRRDASIDDGGILIQVRRRRVHLGGWVSSPQARQRAIQRARVFGALDVDASDLRVVPQPDAGHRNAAPPSDLHIQRAIRDAMVLHPDVGRADRIEFQVRDGVVTLWGMVRTPAEKSAAYQIARDAHGVRHVDDGLRVLGDG